MIIAEIGLNHLGNAEFAEKYCLGLCNVKYLDGITFQVREEEHVIKKPHLYFDPSEYRRLFKIIQDRNKLVGIAINSNRVDFFEDLGVDFYKVIRDGVFYKGLLSSLAKTGKPTLVSVGLCDDQDLASLSKHIKHSGGDIRLVYTNRKSNRLEDANISEIQRLKKYCSKVAYGSHCESYVDLFLSLPYHPSDLLFYVKDSNVGQELPDDIWAIEINEVQDVTEKINLYSRALGSGDYCVL